MTAEEFLATHVIDAPGTTLRKEDLKKARELEAMAAEVARALERTSKKRTPVIVDAAAGKAYVGIFAALESKRPVDVIAIERNPRLAALAAKAVNITVRTADVADLGAWPQEADLVVGLHACGPAFDAIVASAIATKAKRLLLVPCCTSKAIATAAKAEALAVALGMPSQAEVRRRFIQAYIDGARTLTLEAAGYEVEVAQLVPPTVTPHNLVWRARRVGEPTRMQAAADRLERLTSARDLC